MLLQGSLFSTVLEMETGISIISSSNSNEIDNRKIVYFEKCIDGIDSRNIMTHGFVRYVASYFHILFEILNQHGKTPC